VPLVHAVLNRLDAFNAIVYNVQHYGVRCQTVEVTLPRKKGTSPRVHTGIRLDAKIVERLSVGERGISDQIRERLERTFAEDDLDAITREFRDGLMNIAVRVRADFGCEWHMMPRAHQAFAAAVAQRVAGYAPPPNESAAASDLMFFGPNDEPETIGRMRERDDQRAHDYPHLKSALTRTMVRLARHMKVKKDKDHE
jgi:hypothetical protein